MIRIVGVGPGTLQYMTPEALSAIAVASTVVAGARLLESVDLDPETRRIELPASGMADAVIGVLEEALVVGDVVMLVSGDPGFYSLARKVRDHFGRDMVRAIPGISSLQLMACRIGRSWVNVATETLHGRKQPNQSDLVKRLSVSGTLALLLGASDDAVQQMKWLAQDQYLGATWAAVGWDLGLPKEQMYEADNLTDLIRCPYVGRLALLWLERSDDGGNRRNL